MAVLSLFVDDCGRKALHEDGWSWLAALALPLWSMQRKLWRTLVAASAVLPLLYMAVGVAIERVPDEAAQGLLALAWIFGWSIACGALANRWHLRCLRRAGYRLIATESSQLQAGR